MRFVLTFGIVSMLLSVTWARGAPVAGCAAVWSGDRPVPVVVSLELPDQRVLENARVFFPKAPRNLAPLPGPRPWCFPIDDERFAYVQTLYYATRQLRWFERLAPRIGARPAGRIAIELTHAPGEVPSGIAVDHSISFRFPEPALDPTVIAHEVGHEIHYHLAGFVDVIAAKSIQEAKYRQAAEQLGVIEGTANLLSALFTGQSRTGAFSYREAPCDIDGFVRFPDVVPTLEQALRRYVSAAGFRAAYPASVRQMANLLGKPPPLTRAMLPLPDPYLASAAINQPLWKAAIAFGFERVAIHYLAALKGYSRFRSYSDLARRIESTTIPDAEVHAFLAAEFRGRGL